MKNCRRNKIKQTVTAVIVLVLIFAISVTTVLGFSAEKLLPVKEAQGFAAKKTVIEDIYRTDIHGFDKFINLYSVFVKASGTRLFEDAAYGHIIMDTAGKLHFPMERTYEEKYANNLIALAEAAKSAGAEFIYVQAPNKKLEGFTEFPKGAYNYSNEDADAFLSDIENAGIDTLDLRDSILSCGIHPDDIFYDTDHHWTTKASFWAYGEIIDELEKRYGIVCDGDGFYRDLSNYTVTHYDDSFLGAEGRRVGKYVAGVDDYIFIEPAFETDYAIYNMITSPDYPSAVGKFGDTIKQEHILKAPEIETNRYGAYFGYDYGCLAIYNKAADNDIKILLIKDSFALPVTAFLSTCVSEVHMIDLRDADAPIASEYIKENDFDVVIVMYNTEVFNDVMFTFDS